MPYPFDRSELNILLQAPLHAVIAVVLVEEIDPVEFLRRLRCGARILVRSQQQQSNFGSLAAMLSGIAGSSSSPQISLDEVIFARECELLELLQQFGSATEGRQQAIAFCSQASSLLAEKVSYSQAQAYCNWLLSVARSVADTLRPEINAVEIQFQYSADTVLTELQTALTIPTSNL